MRVGGVAYRTVWMDRGVVKMIDQRRLPFEFAILSCGTYEEVAEAIRDMAVRGAGAIGVAAGYGMALAALQAPETRWVDVVARAAVTLRATRPTARNLFYAVERMALALRAAPAGANRSVLAVETAEAIANEDTAAGERIGQLGQGLVGDGARVLTHCNAGWLAFADWGTALAPIYRAKRDGKAVRVYLTETRPRSQGAKLTAWELAQEGVPHTLIADTAVGRLMQQGEVDVVLVGADRIAANGDVANKIGTYPIALLARTHGLPFYVAAPTTTIDLSCPTGADIPIEERSDEEVACAVGWTSGGRQERVRIANEGTAVRNWAFDVTPAGLITGLLTERGLIQPSPDSIQDVMRSPVTGAKA